MAPAVLAALAHASLASATSLQRARQWRMGAFLRQIHFANDSGEKFKTHKNVKKYKNRKTHPYACLGHASATTIVTRICATFLQIINA